MINEVGFGLYGLQDLDFVMELESLKKFKRFMVFKDLVKLGMLSVFVCGFCLRFY